MEYARWTAAEDNRIRLNYPRVSGTDLGLLMGRTGMAIQCRAAALGVGAETTRAEREPRLTGPAPRKPWLTGLRDGRGLPSAEDLDAVAAEDAARVATGGEPMEFVPAAAQPVMVEGDLLPEDERPAAGAACAWCAHFGHYCQARRIWAAPGAEDVPVCDACAAAEDCAVVRARRLTEEQMLERYDRPCGEARTVTPVDAAKRVVADVKPGRLMPYQVQRERVRAADDVSERALRRAAGWYIHGGVPRAERYEMPARPVVRKPGWVGGGEPDAVPEAEPAEEKRENLGAILFPSEPCAEAAAELRTAEGEAETLVLREGKEKGMNIGRVVTEKQKEEIRKHCMEETARQIADRLGINAGTCGYYCGKYRKEHAGAAKKALGSVPRNLKKEPETVVLPEETNPQAAKIGELLAALPSVATNAIEIADVSERIHAMRPVEHDVPEMVHVVLRMPVHRLEIWFAGLSAAEKSECFRRAMEA